MSPSEREKRLTLHLPVEVRGQDLTGVAFTELTRSLNVSGGGIMFECRRPLGIGTRLALAIEVPPRLRHRFGDREVYRARAVVCRVEHREGGEPTRVAARFLPGPPSEPVV
ncbi:MAG TPA: PilZ domain-containing protein [Vicinamibacteria bacterium]|nr:PilZ domain-containing protein [Vicinamibacteria bacterium]